MSFLSVDLKNVDLSDSGILKFVLDDNAAEPSYSPEPKINGYKNKAVRPDIQALLEDGSPAVQTLFAVRRHNYDVVRKRIVEDTVYADEIFSQNVAIFFRPTLLVTDTTANDVVNKIISAFNAFDPLAGIDPEEYAKEQSLAIGIPMDTVKIVGALVFVRQGARASNTSQIDRLVNLYKDNGATAYPISNGNDGVQLNLNSNGYTLVESKPDDLDDLPQPVSSPNIVEVPKGDQVAEDKAVDGVLGRLEERFKGMDCGENFNQQKWKAAAITIGVETKIEWEVREIRGDCFRLEVRVPVLKTRDVQSVLYVLVVNPLDVIVSVLEQTLRCAISSAVDVRVIGKAFINIAAAINAFGALFEACMRYNALDLFCVLPGLVLVTEVEANWH
jgi:hypothetical protein